MRPILNISSFERIPNDLNPPLTLRIFELDWFSLETLKLLCFLGPLIIRGFKDEILSLGVRDLPKNAYLISNLDLFAS